MRLAEAFAIDEIAVLKGQQIMYGDLQYIARIVVRWVADIGGIRWLDPPSSGHESFP
jgi:hypothetical protein